VKTDTIFYSLFQAFPGIFFELIDRSPEEAFTYEFTSREVKQLAFRLDGLFLPTTEDPEQPIYVVEVQFQPDEDLYYRLDLADLAQLIEPLQDNIEDLSQAIALQEQ
jgi:predicted transposase/invertase (TIGR01784 family)